MVQAAPESASDPAGFLFFRPGQISLLLEPVDPAAAELPPLEPRDLDQLRGVLGGVSEITVANSDPFHETPFLRAAGEPASRGARGADRGHVVMRRRGGRHVRALHTVNLAGWHENLHQEYQPDALHSPVRDVGRVVNAVNGRIAALREQGASIAVGPHYRLRAVSPNWLAMPF